MKNMDQTTIQIKKVTRDKLKSVGRKDQTYDDIVENLLEMTKRIRFFNELDKIADNEEFVLLDEI